MSDGKTNPIFTGNYVQQTGGQAAHQFKRTSTNAILCAVTGVLGWSFFPVVGELLAISFGEKAKREIRAAQGMMGGRALITFGMALAIIEVALLVLGFIVPMLLPAALPSLLKSLFAH